MVQSIQVLRFHLLELEKVSRIFPTIFYHRGFFQTCNNLCIKCDLGSIIY